MESLLAPIFIYCLVVLGVYCVRKGLHIKRMLYHKEVDTVLEEYFVRFQEVIVKYDETIYRSDKAYPVLTAPMKKRLVSTSHSFESFRNFDSTFRDEWKYLEQLVGEKIGNNPLGNFHIKKRARAIYGIEELLWYSLAILTVGVWIIWTKR